jgi:C4-dicarboxylate-binding protein DctP
MKVNNQAIADNQAAALATIKANAQVYKLTPEERQAFKDAVEVVYKDYVAQGKLTQAELDTMRAIVAGKK